MTKRAVQEVPNHGATLVEIAREAIEIERMIIEANGELTPELEKRLEFNSQELISKLDGYVQVEEKLEAMADVWKRRADACAAIAKRFSQYRERQRERVKFVMLAMGQNEIRGTFSRYKLSPLKPKLVIETEEKIPASFTMQVTTTIPDKERIAAALAEGFEVAGAKLEPVFRLNSYDVKE